jgi:DUF1009 family protein
MSGSVPQKLGIIAGRGVYPLLLAESARAQGVGELFAVAFKGETDPALARRVDRVVWLRVGQLTGLLDALAASGVKTAVMAGQIAPTHLFRVRPDAAMIALLARLRWRNAHTIFGAVADALRQRGIDLAPASLFMESCMPEAGVLTRRVPTTDEQQDVELGCRVARAVSELEIGQTVVIKQGTILAVEAFEGTDQALLRAGKLGGPGAVVVKVAKPGHDMRFDIPVIGEKTIKVLKKIKAAVLAVEAKRAILLDAPKLSEQADRQGLCLMAIPTEDPQ